LHVIIIRFVLIKIPLRVAFFFICFIPVRGIGIKHFLLTIIMVKTESSMSDVILRLKRVGGQVEGLIRMIEREEECAQIITQFQAAKAALDNTFSLVLHRNLKECMSNDDSKSVEKILKLISKQ
jgi:DNA-binding FrmR family transcriptional regulator